MEERAKRELGMLPEREATAEERIRGKIVEQTTHVKRKQENDAPVPTKRLILILALLGWIAALALGVWWMWWLKQPYRPSGYYRPKDKSARRVTA